MIAKGFTFGVIRSDQMRSNRMSGQTKMEVSSRDYQAEPMYEKGQANNNVKQGEPYKERTY